MQAADNSKFIAFPDLGLSPVALHIGPFDLRWYSLAYLAGIFIAYWYLLKLLKQPGAPLAKRHADEELDEGEAAGVAELRQAGHGQLPELDVWMSIVLATPPGALFVTVCAVSRWPPARSSAQRV